MPSPDFSSLDRTTLARLWWLYHVASVFATTSPASPQHAQALSDLQDALGANQPIVKDLFAALARQVMAQENPQVTPSTFWD